MIIVAIILLLFSTPAHAIQMIGFGVGCASQSTADENTNVATSTSFNSTDLWGQSWLNTNAITLYSFSIYVKAADGNETITLRIGPDVDLSDSGGTYYFEMSDMLDSGTNFWHEFVIPAEDRPSLSASTTYYIGFHTDATFNIGEEIAGYGDGAEYWHADKSSWNMTGDQTAYDIGFRTKKCD